MLVKITDDSQVTILPLDKDTDSINVSPYEDHGLVLDATVIAPGSEAVSSIISNLDWVRNYILFVQCDQTHDIRFYRVDSAGQEDWGTALSTGQTVTGSQYRSVAGTGANGLLGYGVKFAIKNVGASPTTVAKVRFQPIGI